MTYLELCQKMIRDLGLSNSIVTVSSQTGMNRKIVDWIADADEQIQSFWADWNFLHSSFSASTIVGTREYSAPADFGTWDLESFYLNYTSDDYIWLDYIDYKEWREIYRQGTQDNDEPSLFTIEPSSNNIYLEPKPDAVYTLTADYWKTPTRLSADGSTSSIPDRFERIIIARAKIFYAEHDEFPTVFELASSEYRHLLNQLEDAQLPGKNKKQMSRAIDMRVTPA